MSRELVYPYVSIGLDDPKIEHYEELRKIAEEYVKKGYSVAMRSKSSYNAFAVKNLPQREAHLLASIGYDIMDITTHVCRILYKEEIIL